MSCKCIAANNQEPHVIVEKQPDKFVEVLIQLHHHPRTSAFGGSPRPRCAHWVPGSSSTRGRRSGRPAWISMQQWQRFVLCCWPHHHSTGDSVQTLSNGRVAHHCLSNSTRARTLNCKTRRSPANRDRNSHPPMRRFHPQTRAQALLESHGLAVRQKSHFTVSESSF